MFVFDLLETQKWEIPIDPEIEVIGPDIEIEVKAADIGVDGKIVALDTIVIAPSENLFHHKLMDWLGLPRKSTQRNVTLFAIPSGVEIITLPDCFGPVFSPDGKTLAVAGADRSSLQLWDLPIRRPVVKIVFFSFLAMLLVILSWNSLAFLVKAAKNAKTV